MTEKYFYVRQNQDQSAAIIYADNFLHVNVYLSALVFLWHRK